MRVGAADPIAIVYVAMLVDMSSINRDVDVDPPPDAVQVEQWEGPAGNRFRFFKGTHRGSRVSLVIMGFQLADGRVEKRVVHLDGSHVDLTVPDIDALIINLAAAREEILR